MQKLTRQIFLMSLMIGLMSGCDKSGSDDSLPPLEGAHKKLTAEGQLLISQPWCLQYQDEYGLERIYVLNFDKGGALLGSVHEKEGDYLPGLQIEDEGGNGRWALNKEMMLTLQDPKEERTTYALEVQNAQNEAQDLGLCLRRQNKSHEPGECSALLKACRS